MFTWKDKQKKTVYQSGRVKCQVFTNRDRKHRINQSDAAGTGQGAIAIQRENIIATNRPNAGPNCQQIENTMLRCGGRDSSSLFSFLDSLFFKLVADESVLFLK